MFNLQVRHTSARRLVEELPCLRTIYVDNSNICELFLQRKALRTLDHSLSRGLMFVGRCPGVR